MSRVLSSYITPQCDLYQGPSPVLLPLTHADGNLFTIHYLNEKEVRKHCLVELMCMVNHRDS